MHRRTAMIAPFAFVTAWASHAAAKTTVPLGEFAFPSIDGGDIRLSDWDGDAILVVNTASRCGYTGQYEGLQTLHERYGSSGLRVLAVPSDSFDQELASAGEVKEFCDTMFGLTLPMTDITPVKGRGTHPFYAWMMRNAGFRPRWNFNKVLIGRDAQVVDTFGSRTAPLSRKMTSAIEAALSAQA